MQEKEQLSELVERTSKTLASFFTPMCLCRIYYCDNPGNFVCRKLKYFKLSPNNTKHLFVKIPMNLTTGCKDILVDIKLKEEYDLK